MFVCAYTEANIGVYRCVLYAVYVSVCRTVLNAMHLLRLSIVSVQSKPHVTLFQKLTG